MIRDHKSFLATLLILTLTPLVLAEEGCEEIKSINDFNVILTIVAGFLGVLMIAIQGLRWVISESPQERMDIKKAIMYILLGLLAVVLAARIVCLIYCQSIQSYDPTITCQIMDTHCLGCNPIAS